MIAGLSPDSWLHCDPLHPGELIAPHIEPADDYPGMSVAEAARKLGVSRSRLSRVLKGKGPITLDLAMKLEAVGWATADHWVGLQSHYDLAQERKRLNRPLTQAPAWIEGQALLRTEEEGAAPGGAAGIRGWGLGVREEGAAPDGAAAADSMQ